MSVQSYRDLRVWQISMDLVETVYKLTTQFPKHELYGLVSQLQRCAVSIPSNIAEGHTKSHKKEYLQALSTSQGSLSELETQLEIAKRLSYINPFLYINTDSSATTANDDFIGKATLCTIKCN